MHKFAYMHILTFFYTKGIVFFFSLMYFFCVADNVEYVLL